jgi:hypothetical protein
MTGLSGCGDVRLALGVYVVGAIEPAERTIVDIHLSHCPACREELAGLAGLPALLGHVPARDVERLAASGATGNPEEPPPELLSSLLRRVAARRRARKWRTITVAAAAAVIAVAGGLAGGAAISHALSSGSSAASQTSRGYETGRGINARTHVTAVVGYYSAAWGTSMRVRVSGIRAGTTCELWVVDTHGQRSIVGGWTVPSGHQDQWYMASTPVSGSRIRSFQVTAAGRILVTVPAS